VPDCEEAMQLRAINAWVERGDDGTIIEGGIDRVPMTQDDVKAYFRNAPSGAMLTFVDPQTRNEYELTYFQVR